LGCSPLVFVHSLCVKLADGILISEIVYCTGFLPCVMFSKVKYSISLLTHRFLWIIVGLQNCFTAKSLGGIHRSRLLYNTQCGILKRLKRTDWKRLKRICGLYENALYKYFGSNQLLFAFHHIHASFNCLEFVLPANSRKRNRAVNVHRAYQFCTPF